MRPRSVALFEVAGLSRRGADHENDDEGAAFCCAPLNEVLAHWFRHSDPTRTKKPRQKAGLSGSMGLAELRCARREFAGSSKSWRRLMRVSQVC